MTSETAVQPPPPRWGARRTLAAAVVAAVIGAVGGAAIYAATEGSASNMSSGPHFIGGPAHGGPPSGDPHPPPGPTSPAGVLHSEYVVPDDHGGFTTKLTQTGKVDEVTLSSVVVRSDDGYTQIYGFPSSAAGPTVAANDTVTVDATRTGPTVTLTSIGEDPPPGS